MKTTNENLRLIKPFLRGLPIIVAIVALSMLLAKRYVKYATPMYESTAKIRLADSKDGSPSANLYKDFDVFANANKIGAELEVLKSKVLINKALDSIDFNITTYRVGQIRKIELYQECPFIINANLKTTAWYDKPFHLTIASYNNFSLQIPGNAAIINTSFGTPIFINGDSIIISINKNLLSAKPNLTLAAKYEFIINSRQKLIDDVISNLDVTSVDKEIPVIRITYKSPIAEKAADFVNRLSETYVSDYIETKSKAANTTVYFLNEQLNEVSGRLAASENAIENYRDKKHIINIRQETETDLRKIADMKVQQTNVKMNLEAAEDLYSYMRSGRAHALELAPNFEAYTDLLATEMVKKMKILQAEKKDLLIKYTPEHEQIKAIDDKLHDITTYLEEGISNTRKNLQVKYERLSNDINEAEQVFNGLPTREKTMNILSRNFMLNEQTYNFLHEKRTEAQIARAATISFHRIISPADVARAPISPNATLIKILAAFLGFLGSVTLIYIVHAIKGKVNDATTIEKKSSIPIAACVPMLKKTNQVLLYFHKLALQLEIKNLLQPKSVLTISSFDKEEGKLFNTIHLAKELVLQNKKVLIADADGSMNKKMQNVASGFQYLDLTAMPGIFTNSEILKQQLITWKQQYDYVIVKNESINHAANGLLLMKLADANLFIMHSRRTPAKMVTETELLQEEYKFNNMQFLLNGAGYNPNLLAQAFDFIKLMIQKIAKK